MPDSSAFHLPVVITVGLAVLLSSSWGGMASGVDFESLLAPKTRHCSDSLLLGKEGSDFHPQASPTIKPTFIAADQMEDTVDNAMSDAVKRLEPYVKGGFEIQESYWGGELPMKWTRLITYKLNAGMQYWFCIGTAETSARPTVRIYDVDGKVAEAESWLKPHSAGACVIPSKTGDYHIIIEVESSKEKRVMWALVEARKPAK